MSSPEARGFVPKAELEGINVSHVHPLREAALLAVGVVGVAVALFLGLALVIDLAAPLIPPSIETTVLGWWGRHIQTSMDDEARHRADAVRPVLDRLLERWTESPYPIQVAIEDSADINAYALPGGTILITTGLLDTVSDEMELAFVLGHELGHFARRDQMRGLGRAITVGMLELTLASYGIGQPALNLVNHLDQATARRFDRQQETDADVFAVDILLSCYGRTDGARDFLAKLGAHEAADTSAGLGYLSTHPATGDRLTGIKARVEKIY